MPRPFSLRILLSVFIVSAFGAAALAQAPRQELDIPYVPGGGHRQQLDLYWPERTGFATILFVHGGSLESGDRTEFHLPEICQNFVKAGFGCATTSYRLLEDGRWPAQPMDVAHALDFQKAAARVGARVEVKELANRKHMTALEKMAEPGDPTFLEILRFLRSATPKE